MSKDSVHLIDENKQFNRNLVQYIEKCYPSVNDDGRNYHIVSVFGSQSSGKSTLLNRLFGTRFDVMDELKRQQTTKGIWFSHANHIASATRDLGSHQNSNNIFVLDVEGADGRERADDKDFERKAALFALSTSEVLIVNIWENQVGLYQGANMELLKTVLEVNLSLFHSNKQKVLLLFVIRDFSGATTMDNLSETLTKDMNNTWESLNKPEGAEDFKLSDFFDLEFFAIGHKRFQPEQFELNIKELGDEFNAENKIFKKEYHRGVPIDAWALYSEQVWNQIEENKDLDLPTQQILVARFRCDEILEEAYQSFLTSYQNSDFDSIVDNPEAIVTILKKLRDDALEIYDNNAQRYTTTVYQERRSSLINKIDSTLKTIHDSQMHRITKELFTSLPEEVSSLKKSNKLISFGEHVEIAANATIEQFQKRMSIFEISENFSIANDMETFKLALTEQLEEIKIRERDHLLSRLTRNFQRKLKEFVIEILNKPTESSWDFILDQFKLFQSNAISKYQDGDSYDFKLGLPSNINEETAFTLKKSFWMKFYDIIHDYVSEDTAARILRSVFEDAFKYDSTGVPRIWSSIDEVDKCFTEAKSFANKALPILSVAKLSDNSEIIPDIDISHDHHDSDSDSDNDELPNHSFSHLLTAKQQSKIRDRFKKESDALYIDAKRSVVSSITTIPYYIYMIILVLGWNEFMIVLRNPFLITLCILLVTGIYFTYNTNTLGPILSVVQVSLTHTKAMAKDRLRDMLKEDDQFVSPPKLKEDQIELDDLDEKEK